MWMTLEDGRRVRVRKDDVEMLHCAIAQEHPRGIAYATVNLMANSKQMVRNMTDDLFAFMDQMDADRMGLGINEKTGGVSTGSEGHTKK